MTKPRVMTLRQHQSMAGSTKSAAKSAAARENGKKGGRPRKVQDPAMPEDIQKAQ